MSFSAISRHKWTRSLFSFGIMHATTLLLPLLAFPWVGRKLEPECFGLLMNMCMFPPILLLVIEWGFPLGATREAARSRGDDKALGALLGTVVSGKILLAGACLVAAILLMPFLPHVPAYPGAYFLALLMGLGRGLTPFWFYQGTGLYLRRLVLWDISSSLAALALVFIFVDSPADWPLYLLFSAICKLASNICLTAFIWIRFGARLDFSGGFERIRKTRVLFSGLFFTTAYQYMSPLALAFFLSAPQMGVIVAFGKMLRALTSMVSPLTQAIFPEVCIMRDKNPLKARSTLRKSLAGTCLGGICLIMGIWPLAPLLVRIALGPAYEEWANAFRIMLLSIPFAACNHVLGLQTLIPFGQEKVQSAIRCGATVLSLPLAAGLGYVGGITGAAILPLVMEGVILTSLAIAVLKLCPNAFFPLNR